MTWEHHFIALAFLVALGAAVGSFLNVCIYRLPRGESVIRPRSRCPRCAAAISSRDNVPIVGWLLLKGRCRGCDLPISMRYPLVEALTAFLFAAVYLAEVALNPRDPFERGIGLVFVRLNASWIAASLLVALAFIMHDLRQSARRAVHPGALERRASLVAVGATAADRHAKMIDSPNGLL